MAGRSLLFMKNFLNMHNETLAMERIIKIRKINLIIFIEIAIRFF